MGKFSRDKGKRYERKIARRLRERFPELADNIRRSIQSREAEESDVTGVPKIWLECQDAAKPTPRAKLLQAIEDVRANNIDAIPVAITHKTRSKTDEVTMLADDFYAFFKKAVKAKPCVGDIRVQIDLESFLTLLEITKPWK